MSIYTIYRATNTITGKVYIGFDSNWPARISTHRSSSKKLKKPFYLAIKKYGWEKFIWEPIYQSKDGVHTLSTMEREFITEYRSYVGFNDCNGYNLTLGGDGCLGRIESAVTKNKKSLAQKGKKRGPMTDKQRELLSTVKQGKPWSEKRTAIGYSTKNKEDIKNPMYNADSVKKMLETRKRNKLLKQKPA